MHILKKGPVIIAALIFLISSFLFPHLCRSIELGVSGFSYTDLLQHLYYYLYNSLLILFAIILLLKKIHWSKGVFLFVFLWTAVNLFSIYIGGESKVVLFISLAYFLLGTFVTVLLWLELREVIYNPCYSRFDIGKKGRYRIPVTLVMKDKKEILGEMTNWNKRGCFISLQGKWSKKDRVADLYFTYENRKFYAQTEVWTSYDQGIGVYVTYDSKTLQDHYVWKEFYRIIFNRGYFPYYQGQLI